MILQSLMAFALKPTNQRHLKQKLELKTLIIRPVTIFISTTRMTKLLAMT